ncbi:MAG: SGNH/GDSL hydrolase family protein [Planctomycetota bacterium]|jgi:lysophospholipase L1-like esterase
MRALPKKLLFSLVPLVLLLVLLEVGFRVVGLGRPEVKPPSDPESVEVERTAPDGRKSVYKRKTMLGVEHTRNELGCRDWLYEEEEREGAIRIAGIGDSFTEGFGVRYEDVWLQVLGRRLRAARPDGPPIRTLNFGRGGMNTADEVKLLEEQVLRFGPRLVVLGFTVFNDAETKEVYQAATEERVQRESKSHFRLARWIKDHSYFANWLVETLRREKRREGMRVHLAEQYADDEPGWVECRDALAHLAETCRRENVALVVALFPVHHDDIALNDWGSYEHHEVHGKIKAVFDAHPDVAVVDVVEGFAPLTGKKIWIDVDRHPTAEWHERVAELLTEPVLEKLDLKPR